MRSAVAFCVFFVATLALARPGDDTYTDEYDNIDYKEIISNPGILKNYVNCLLDKGKCPPPGTELKKHMTDAFQNDCTKCTDKQKEGAKYVIKYLYNNEKAYYDELQAKYDPDNAYFKQHEKELTE